MNLQIADCLPAWLRGCLMTSNDCTRDRIAIKYRIFGLRVWRSKQRIEQTIECIHQILLLCLPPLKRSTDLNDRNVHEISICSNVIFEHNLSIDEGGNPSKWKREIERVFAIDLTSQEVSLCVFVFVFGFESSRNSTTTAKAKKKKWFGSRKLLFLCFSISFWDRICSPESYSKFSFAAANVIEDLSHFSLCDLKQLKTSFGNFKESSLTAKMSAKLCSIRFRK